jgi:hypothetical protein
MHVIIINDKDSKMIDTGLFMLEKNLKNIETYNSELAQRIRTHILQIPYTFEVAGSGDVNLYYNNNPLHSIQNPQQEALEIYESLPNKTESAITVIFGLGLGYLFKRLYLSFPGRIIIFEPNIDILRITFENVDFSPELADPRVIIANTQAELEAAMKSYYMIEDPLNIGFLPSYRLLFPEIVQNLTDSLTMFKKYLDNDTSTLYNKSKMWINMALANFKHLFNSQYIDCLKDQFHGIPAIIVSAGPSLNKNVDQLKEYENDVVIFCLGKALRVLTEENNILPHFAVYADSHEYLLKQVEGVNNLDKINAIVQPTIYKPVYDLEFKRKFFYLAENSFYGSWLAKQLNLNISHFENYGTVAITALFAAINFGCNPIIFLGQDLAFAIDGPAYADKKEDNVFRKKATLQVKGWHGDTVTTIGQYADNLKDFEILSRIYGEKVRLINATEGGAYIPGLEHMTFSEASSLLTNKHLDIDSIISTAENNYINPVQKSKLKVINALKTHKSGFKKLAKFIRNARATASKIDTLLEKENPNPNLLNSLFNDLCMTNAKLNQVLNKECHLLMNYIQKEGSEYNQKYRRFIKQDNIEHYKLYISLYNNIYKAMLENIPILEKHIDNILTGKL